MNDSLRQLLQYMNSLGQPDPQVAQQVAQAQLAAGQTKAGNIDLNQRPIVYNKDGSYSTVRSMTVGGEGEPAHLIPTVSDDGRIMSDDEAVQTAKRTGRELGTFKDSASANSYAQSLHEDQAGQYEQMMRRGDPTTGPPNPMRALLGAVPRDTVPANAPGASVQNLREVPPGQDDTPAHSEEWNRGMPGGGAQSSAVQPAELALGLPMAADSMLAKMAGRAVAREGAERGASMVQVTPESHAAALKALRELRLSPEGVEATFGSHAARVAKVAARVAADQGEKALARAEPTGAGKAAAVAQRYSPELTEQLLKHLAEGLAK